MKSLFLYKILFLLIFDLKFISTENPETKKDIEMEPRVFLKEFNKIRKNPSILSEFLNQNYCSKIDDFDTIPELGRTLKVLKCEHAVMNLNKSPPSKTSLKLSRSLSHLACIHSALIGRRETMSFLGKYRDSPKTWIRQSGDVDKIGMDILYFPKDLTDPMFIFAEFALKQSGLIKIRKSNLFEDRYTEFGFCKHVAEESVGAVATVIYTKNYKPHIKDGQEEDIENGIGNFEIVGWKIILVGLLFFKCFF